MTVEHADPDTDPVGRIDDYGNEVDVCGLELEGLNGHGKCGPNAAHRQLLLHQKRPTDSLGIGLSWRRHQSPVLHVLGEQL